MAFFLNKCCQSALTDKSGNGPKCHPSAAHQAIEHTALRADYTVSDGARPMTRAGLPGVTHPSAMALAEYRAVAGAGSGRGLGSAPGLDSEPIVPPA